MRKVLVTAPTFRPMEPDLILVRPEIRGIASEADKLLIADFLTSAVEEYERHTENILCRSVWDIYLDGFPDDDDADIELPAPLYSVASVKYQDSSDVQQTLAAAGYVVDTSSTLAGRIALASGESWPSTYDELNAVVIRLTVGYANAGAIPRRILDGLVAYIQEMFSGIDMSGVYYDRWSEFRRMGL